MKSNNKQFYKFLSKQIQSHIKFNYKITIKSTLTYELIARIFGFKSWNILNAKKDIPIITAHNSNIKSTCLSLLQQHNIKITEDSIGCFIDIIKNASEDYGTSLDSQKIAEKALYEYNIEIGVEKEEAALESKGCMTVGKLIKILSKYDSYCPINVGIWDEYKLDENNEPTESRGTFRTLLDVEEIHLKSIVDKKTGLTREISLLELVGANDDCKNNYLKSIKSK